MIEYETYLDYTYPTDVPDAAKLYDVFRFSAFTRLHNKLVNAGKCIPKIKIIISTSFPVNDYLPTC